jgi:hypothetical protein
MSPTYYYVLRSLICWGSSTCLWNTSSCCECINVTSLSAAKPQATYFWVIIELTILMMCFEYEMSSNCRWLQSPLGPSLCCFSWHLTVRPTDTPTDTCLKQVADRISKTANLIHPKKTTNLAVYRYADCRLTDRQTTAPHTIRATSSCISCHIVISCTSDARWRHLSRPLCCHYDGTVICYKSTSGYFICVACCHLPLTLSPFTGHVYCWRSVL